MTNAVTKIEPHLWEYITGSDMLGVCILKGKLQRSCPKSIYYHECQSRSWKEHRQVHSLILSGVKATSLSSGFQPAPTACKVRTVFFQRTWQKYLHTLYFSMGLLKLWWITFAFISLLQLYRNRSFPMEQWHQGFLHALWKVYAASSRRE